MVTEAGGGGSARPSSGASSKNSAQFPGLEYPCCTQAAQSRARMRAYVGQYAAMHMWHVLLCIWNPRPVRSDTLNAENRTVQNIARTSSPQAAAKLFTTEREVKGAASKAQ